MCFCNVMIGKGWMPSFLMATTKTDQTAQKYMLMLAHMSEGMFSDVAAHIICSAALSFARLHYENTPIQMS